MSSFIAAIFDMDGVIVDNHHYHVESWRKFCAIHSVPFAEKDFRKHYFGKNNKDILEGLFSNKIPRNEAEKLGEEKEEIYRDLYKPYITPVTGLIPFINRIRELSIKTAIATSAPTSNLNFVVDSLGINHLFDVITDISDVSMGKPHPEIYLKTAERLGVNPVNCIVFEDSLSGIKAAQNAGMSVIGLATTHLPEELPDNILIIKDYTRLSL